MSFFRKAYRIRRYCSSYDGKICVYYIPEWKRPFSFNYECCYMYWFHSLDDAQIAVRAHNSSFDEVTA